MAEALARAGLAAGQIDHINAHGTGTPLNDASEARAIRDLFGVQAARIPVTSTKSQLGHLLGGSGGVEAVTLVLSLQHQTIPPTLRCDAPDPAIGLEVVAGPPRRAALRYGLSNSFGFGGTNYALLFAAAA
jgi:3-oxoacyl-[acyl-carrier-protein] synthase II